MQTLRTCAQPGCEALLITGKYCKDHAETRAVPRAPLRDRLQLMREQIAARLGRRNAA